MPSPPLCLARIPLVQGQVLPDADVVLTRIAAAKSMTISVLENDNSINICQNNNNNFNKNDDDNEQVLRRTLNQALQPAVVWRQCLAMGDRLVWGLLFGGALLSAAWVLLWHGDTMTANSYQPHYEPLGVFEACLAAFGLAWAAQWALTGWGHYVLLPRVQAAVEEQLRRHVAVDDDIDDNHDNDGTIVFCWRFSDESLSNQLVLDSSRLEIWRHDDNDYDPNDEEEALPTREETTISPEDHWHALQQQTKQRLTKTATRQPDNESEGP